MKKKKVLLALLASLCVGASATAFAACQEGNVGDVKDPALYAAYQTYAESKGDDALSYEEWVNSIIEMLEAGGIQGPAGDNGENGKDGVGIVDVEIEIRGGVTWFIFHLSNGQDLEVPAL